MSDLASEAGSKVEQLIESYAQQFFDLLKLLLDKGTRDLNKRLDKIRFKQLQNERANAKDSELVAENKDALVKRSGLIKFKKLLKSGDPLKAIGFSTSQKDVDRLIKLSKAEKFDFAITKNPKIHNRINEIEKELNKMKKRGLIQEQEQRYEQLTKELKDLESKREEGYVVVRERDLDKMLLLIGRVNQENRLEEINEKAKEYLEKGEEYLSDAELKDYQNLLAEKNEVVSEEFAKFNSENTNRILTERDIEEDGFEHAFAMVSDRDFADNTCYMCDRTNPENYIEASKVLDKTAEGEMRCNTQYRVFRKGQEYISELSNNGEYLQYHQAGDMSANIKQSEYFDKLRKEIQEKSQISNDVLLFSSKEQFDEYRKQFEQQREDAIPVESTIGVEADSESYKDYTGIVNTLKSQLADHKMAIANTGALVKTNGEPVRMSAKMPDDEKMEAMEMISIAKQIGLYTKLNANQTKSAMISNEIASFTERGNSVPKELNTKMAACKEEAASLEFELEKLKKERLKIESIIIFEKSKPFHLYRSGENDQQNNVSRFGENDQQNNVSSNIKNVKASVWKESFLKGFSDKISRMEITQHFAKNFSTQHFEMSGRH